MSEYNAEFGMHIPAVRRLDLDRPWHWLEQGWQDFRDNPLPSLAYGALATVTSWLVTWGLFWLERPYLILPLAGGFLIVAPLFACGLYDLSRRRQEGTRGDFASSLLAPRRNPTQIGLMGIVLLMGFIFWVEIAIILFMMWFGLEPPPFYDLFAATFLQIENIGFVIIGTLLGGVIAAVIFSLSAVSIPMLIDRPQSNVALAIMTSFKAVRRNPYTMALWAALIVLFTGAGIALLYIGLLVTLPLIGHATWHAYLDVVREQ